MGTLFIIGNGFDLAHGMSTRYSDFRKFLVEAYPEAAQRSKTMVSMEYLSSKDKEEIAVEFLLCAMDVACGETWYDFEDALARIHFFDKWPKSRHKDDEDDDREQATNHLMKMLLMNDYVFDAINKYWGIFLSRWIRSVENKIETGVYIKRGNIEKLINQKNCKFFTFNYTKTLQILYGVKKVVHIHNRVGQKLIFGHGVNEVHYQEPAVNGHFGSMTCDEILEHLRKNTGRQLKKYNKDFADLLDVNEVYSYGFSFSQVDSIYIKEIIGKLSSDTTWYFTRFEAKDVEQMRLKKIKLRRYGYKGEFDVFEG